MDENDTPHERALYAYNKAGEQVAYVSGRVFEDAQKLAREGRRHMNLAEPPRETTSARYEGNEAQRLVGIMTVELFEWRHRRHPSRWAIRFLSDDDQHEYLRWYPTLALDASSSGTTTHR